MTFELSGSYFIVSTVQCGDVTLSFCNSLPIQCMFYHKFHPEWATWGTSGVTKLCNIIRTIRVLFYIKKIYFCFILRWKPCCHCIISVLCVIRKKLLIMTYKHLIRGAQIPCAMSLWQLDFLWWHRISAGPVYETCFMSLFWFLEFWASFQIFGKFVHSCIT